MRCMCCIVVGISDPGAITMIMLEMVYLLGNTVRDVPFAILGNVINISQ